MGCRCGEWGVGWPGWDEVKEGGGVLLERGVCREEDECREGKWEGSQTKFMKHYSEAERRDGVE